MQKMKARDEIGKRNSNKIDKKIVIKSKKEAWRTKNLLPKSSNLMRTKER